MRKKFEDCFSELQSDMVAICLEYVENRAEDIYIYCSYEPEMYAFDVSFRINGRVVLKNHLNHAVKETNDSFTYDTSEQRQMAVLDIGLKDLEDIHALCKEYGRDMPTEMKLHYNVKQNSLKAQYKYDLIYSEDEELLPDDIFDAWLDEIKKSG
ncbi:DUF600 domain-containing protein [Fictibacillus sp. S7]|uniref:DUF600 domain-containing protein n=1 Tax=Fictibacillus sp. S7 TaxID=2212476 RepID=UPI001010AD24|nr:DUF600 domain-containing protein [Fictibacillus sp. S7]RXZ01518.1 DUF600 domain-containing protein [Fictibacillus sp. S7]